MCTKVAKNPVPPALLALDYGLTPSCCSRLVGCLPGVGLEEFPHLAATTS